MAEVRHLLHPIEVGAGAERRPTCGEDYRAHLRQTAQPGKHIGDFGDHDFVESVTHRRPIKVDRGNTFVALDFDRGVIHSLYRSFKISV
jgi:hypothetical protein